MPMGIKPMGLRIPYWRHDVAVLNTSAVQAAVASSPAMTTAIVSASSVTGGESVTSAGEGGGMEFTLDASTLEQLRGAGDASALMESSAVAAVGLGETLGSVDDQQATMQVCLLHYF